MPGLLGWVGFLSTFYVMNEYSSNEPFAPFKANNGKNYNYKSYLILRDGIVPSVFGGKPEGSPDYVSLYFSALKEQLKSCYKKTKAQVTTE